MPVSYRWEAAEAMTHVLAAAAAGAVPSEADIDRALSTPGYQAFLRHHATAAQADPVSGESYREMLRGLADSRWAGTGTRLNAMRGNYRRAFAGLGRLAEALTMLPVCDLSQITASVLALLPAGTPLVAEVHLIIDGYTRRFVAGDQLYVDALALTAGDLRQAAQGWAHELHHLGYVHWRRRDPGWRRLRAAADSRLRLAAVLLDELLGEGSAAYYFGGHRPEVAGRDLVEFEILITDLLEDLAEPRDCLRRAQDFLDAEAGRPRLHRLGAGMVGVLARAAGPVLVAVAIRELAELFPLYNRVAQGFGEVAFLAGTAETVRRALTG